MPPDPGSAASASSESVSRSSAEQPGDQELEAARGVGRRNQRQEAASGEHLRKPGDRHRRVAASAAR